VCSSDLADLEGALARFGELQPSATPLNNTAAEVLERFRDSFRARDWTAIALTIASDVVIDDRRLAVNSGFTQGREAVIDRMRVTADADNVRVRSTTIATRGERLVLMEAGYSGGDDGQESFRTELLIVAEINVDGELLAHVIFDPEDIHSAFEELDARYLAGEAADYFGLWSEIAQSYEAMNCHQIPATMSDWVTTDHRVRESFEGGELSAYANSAWDLIPDVSIRIEAVHRLTDSGAVYTHVAYGTSQDGFQAEWRNIVLLRTHQGDRSHCELFDESDLAAALAKFDGV